MKDSFRDLFFVTISVGMFAVFLLRTEKEKVDALLKSKTKEVSIQMQSFIIGFFYFGVRIFVFLLSYLFFVT